MSVNLDSLSLAELRELRNKVERAISSYEERRRKDALAAVESAAREHGFNLAELTGVKISRSKSAPKYANPENPEMTWSGRGRKPRWVQEHLDSGKPIEDLAI